ncbi:hypothetical protein IFR05_017113 [Cadophora sp. M221]|nr:hypothetical protein IFR05_017113 [Cadophora sp. M221]
MWTLGTVTGLTASSLIQVVTAQDSNSPIQVVNLVNPLWALPNGENSTNGLGASVVNVDSTATTYAVSCDATAELVQGPTPISCIWETVEPQIFTLWESSLLFTIRTTGFEDVATYNGEYNFPFPLAPTITGTFSLSIAASQVTQAGETIPAQTSTALQTGVMDATWYRIPVTAGEEKLVAVGSSLVTGSLSSTSTVSQGTGTDVSSSLGDGSGTRVSSTASLPTITSMEPTRTGSVTSVTSGGEVAETSLSTAASVAVAEKAGGKVGWVGAMVGGILGLFVL